MHISWGWIKQRPQFIAEEMARYCQVDVLYRKSNRRIENINPVINDGNLSVKGFRNWPFERIQFVPCSISHQINKVIWRSKGIDLNSYDYIWITDPVLWWTIKGHFVQGKTKLIYDCMDDLLAFPYMDAYPKFKHFNEKREQELIKDADYVLCSAKALEEKLVMRYNIQRIYHIINNAITDNIMHYSEIIEDIDIPSYSLVYIGTISEWFDFENTLKVLDEYPKLKIILYGPKRLPEIPTHDRLIFRGPTPHENILAIMKKSMGLIMPFKVNDLIESVNPVKLYEYIYSGKPVLATRYGETLPFEKYINLYSSLEEYKHFVNGCLNNTHKISAKEMKEFAIQNTWKNRVCQIKETIGIYE